jgi:hypothetical protein
MSGPRFLAVFLAACALLASALVAIPLDSAEVFNPGSSASVADSDTFRLTGAPGKVAPVPTQSDVDTPRLWLGR